ncbi:hypothetical protein GJ496_000922 [Pomphorhynchus laevis]|nr:hypothetical protein GJ496_000922 [Pomphorhynchus laevis]
MSSKKLRCYFCNKISHVQICCQVKKHKTTRINEVQEALFDDEIALLQVEAEDVEIFQVQSYEGPSISVKLNNQSCVMDYDTGAAISTLPATIWRNIGCPSLRNPRWLKSLANSFKFIYFSILSNKEF